jgi:hypothetical protein
MGYYTPAYHAACRKLVSFGAPRPERSKAARKTIAQALRDVRRGHGRAAARRERYHLLFIAGHFPDKESH